MENCLYCHELMDIAVADLIAMTVVGVDRAQVNYECSNIDSEDAIEFLELSSPTLLILCLLLA